MKMLHIQRFIHIVVAVALIAMTVPFSLPVQTATITSFSDNLSRLQTSTLADHTIKFVSPSGVGALASFTITFDSDFTMGTFALANFDLATASTCNGSFSDRTLVTGIPLPVSPNWRVNQSGQTITFTNDNSGVFLENV